MNTKKQESTENTAGMSLHEIATVAERVLDKKNMRELTGRVMVDFHRRLIASVSGATDQKVSVRKRRKTVVTRPIGTPADAGKLKACREGSTRAIFVDMLNRKEGASIEELATEVGWAPVSARSALNQIAQQKGYGINQDDDHRFHLVMPTGVKTPLEHTPRKGSA